MPKVTIILQTHTLENMFYYFLPQFFPLPEIIKRTDPQMVAGLNRVARSQLAILKTIKKFPKIPILSEYREANSYSVLFNSFWHSLTAAFGKLFPEGCSHLEFKDLSFDQKKMFSAMDALDIALLEGIELNVYSENKYLIEHSSEVDSLSGKFLGQYRYEKDPEGARKFTMFHQMREYFSVKSALTAAKESESDQVFIIYGSLHLIEDVIEKCFQDTDIKVETIDLSYPDMEIKNREENKKILEHRSSDNINCTNLDLGVNMSFEMQQISATASFSQVQDSNKAVSLISTESLLQNQLSRYPIESIPITQLIQAGFWFAYRARLCAKPEYNTATIIWDDQFSRDLAYKRMQEAAAEQRLHEAGSSFEAALEYLFGKKHAQGSQQQQSQQKQFLIDMTNGNIDSETIEKFNEFAKIQNNFERNKRMSKLLVTQKSESSLEFPVP